MSTPRVNQTEIDGGLGILPGTGLKPRAVVGVASQGPIDTPSSFADAKKLQAVFGRGPGVAAAALVIALYGVPVLFTRTGQSVQGSYLDAVSSSPGTISAFDNTAVSGTSDFSDNTSVPLLAGNWRLFVIAGGTRGTAGIVLQAFRDAGDGAGFVSFGVYSLGTATHQDLGGGSGVSVNLSAGTLVAGDVATFTTTAPIPASAGELVVTGAGTSAVTIHAGTHPDDSYEVRIKFTAGTTIGVAGGKYQTSLDDGRTYDPEIELGTANNIVIANSGGVRVDFGAGTVLAGQEIAFPTVEPQWNNSEVASAIDAAKLSAVQWDGLHVVGALNGSAFDVVAAKFAGDLRHYWIGSFRLPVGAESEADYLTAFNSTFSARSTLNGVLCSGADEPLDALTGRKYRRPWAFAVSARDASVSEEVNLAQIDAPGGAFPGSNLRDEDGNPKHHDESIFPGLDDARSCVARTDPDYAGVFVNRMRVFSPAGSDFYILPLRRVMNLGHMVVQAYFKHRLSKEVLVSRKTGLLLASERVSIQDGATKALRSVLLAKPKASDARVTLSLDDNVLSTRKVTGKYRIVPLAYPEAFDLEGGFENPALNVTAV